jgi:osmoprotectant transport system permease protein
VAIRQVPEGAVDAARALGYGEGSVLGRIELGLGASLILAGVRVAAIQVVATEPIRAFLGGDGLGRYVRDGFGQNNTTLVIGGIVLIGALAALTGLLFVAFERIVLPVGVRRLARQPREQRS